MRIGSLVLGLVVVLPVPGAEQQPLAPEAQTAAAFQAAPEDRRAGATCSATRVQGGT
jgi:hypothetical protein